DGEESVSSLLETPEPYSLTAATALEASLRAADGDPLAGYQTPASAYGADFVTEFEDVNRVDLE
ncbi:MAG: saccharopine dehydrogenase, partial [Halobacteria archaeon]|nr:saccharopine dehydrogenase [Halobacteria archaeon]